MDETIKEIFIRVFAIPAEQYGDALSPAEVKTWDSLGHVQMVMGLQQAFGVEFDVDEVMAMETVRKIKEMLAKHGVS